MDRIDIYNKYLLNLNKECYYENSYNYEYGAIMYYVYRTKDTGVMFSCATRVSDKFSVDYVMDDNGIEIPAVKIEVVGTWSDEGKYIPCLSLNLGIVNKFGPDVALDLRCSELSNILDINLLSAWESSKTFKKVMYPTGKRRLKPVKAVHVLGTNSWKDNIKEIDFSCCISMRGLFENNDKITEFDFGLLNTQNLEDLNRMFSGCSKLKSVSGHIESKKFLSIAGMFSGCINLETIDEGLFAGSRVYSISNSFYDCELLKNKPLSSKNVADFCVDVINTYRRCNANDSESMFSVIVEVIKHECEIDNPFYGMQGNFTTGSVEVKLKSIIGIFVATDIPILNLMDTKFTCDGYGIADMFVGLIGDRNRSWYNDMEHGIALGQTCKDELGIYYNALNIPRIIICNKTLNIHRLDRAVFNVMEMPGCSIHEVNSKIQMLSMLNSDERYLIIV